jgi:hypothetical protein
MKWRTILTGLTLFALAMAQQTNYDIQLSNEPAAVTAVSGCVRFSTACPNLATSLNSVPAGGILVIPSGTFTVGTVSSPALTAARANVKIQCQPGAVINAGARNVTMITVTASNLWLDGCTFDGQFSQHSYSITAVISALNVTNPQVTNSTFQNIHGIAIYTHGVTQGYFYKNLYSAIGNGTLQNNVDDYAYYSNGDNSIQSSYETCQNFTSNNCWRVSDTLNFSSDHATITNTARIGIEVFPTTYRGPTNIKVTNCTINQNTNVADGGFVAGLSMNTIYSGHYPSTDTIEVGGCKVNNTGGMYGHGYPLEIYSSNFNLHDNYISGNWAVNTFFGAGKWGPNNVVKGMASGISTNLSTGYGAPGSTEVFSSRFSEVEATNSSPVLVFSDDLNIHDLSISRTPGLYAADNGSSYGGIYSGSDTASGTFRARNNVITFAAGTTTGFTAYGIEVNTLANDTLVEGNTIRNLGTSPYGQAYACINLEQCDGVKMFNNTYEGLLTMGSNISGGHGNNIYGGNTAVAGKITGSSIISVALGSVSGTFAVSPAADLITGGRSFATGHLIALMGSTALISIVSGTFQASETMTQATTSASAALGTIGFVPAYDWTVQSFPTMVGNLPSASAGNPGMTVWVSNANSTTIGSTVAQGGSHNVQVTSTGAIGTWIITAVGN